MTKRMQDSDRYSLTAQQWKGLSVKHDACKMVCKCAQQIMIYPTGHPKQSRRLFQQSSGCCDARARSNAQALEIELNGFSVSCALVVIHFLEYMIHPHIDLKKGTSHSRHMCLCALFMHKNSFHWRRQWHRVCLHICISISTEHLTANSRAREYPTTLAQHNKTSEMKRTKAHKGEPIHVNMSIFQRWNEEESMLFHKPKSSWKYINNNVWRVRCTGTRIP